MKARFLPHSVTLALFTSAACVPTAPPQDTVPATEDAIGGKGIVGGNAVSITDYPWQISLQSNYGYAFCGGSIIHAEWILTAQHCVEGESASGLRVVAGISRLSQSSSGQIRGVDQIVRYPGYVSPEYGEDVALLHLSTPLDLSASGVAVIDLVTSADDSAGMTDPGVQATVSGWGTLSSGGSSPDTLQAVSVPIVSQSAANSAYSDVNITSDQIGAGLIGTGGRDSCQGDSGGPLTVPDGAGGRRLAGVVSWGYSCADSRWPGMYARVSSFASWIQGYVEVNAAPSVSITSPSSGATLSGQISVQASASDADGRVVRVTFTLPDGQTISDSSAPYAVTWDSSGFADGAAIIRAQAFDDDGASSSQAQVVVYTSNGNASCASGSFAASDTPISIPDNDSLGISSSLVVNGSGTVDDLQVALRITHTYRGDLVVTLVAPSGNAAVLSNRAGGSADDLVLTGAAVSTFDGEPAAGAWTLRVQDLAGQDLGRLESWSLTIGADCGSGGGTTPPPSTGGWSASATPNVATVDDGVVCDSVTVTGGGDAADVMLDLAGTHDWRSILRGTLEHDGAVVQAFSTGTFDRQGGSFGFTDEPISGFSGSASGTWTLCIYDTDGYGDTGVLTSWGVHD